MKTSTRRPALVIAGERIRAGQSRELELPFGESYLGTPQSIPVYVIAARKSGPRVFITSTIHGDELNGLGIVRALLYEKPPKLVKGTLIFIPVVNIHGLERHTRYMPDRRDLNRCFPGSATGSQTRRLAHAIYTEIIRQCDYGIDFHSAAVRRTNYPNVRANTRDSGTRMLAKVFGGELIVNSNGPDGSLRRTAVDAGVPTIILEAGEVWKIEPSVVEVGVRGCQNVLRALGMLEGRPQPPSFQIIADKTVWVRSDQGGILGFHVRPGQLVRQGEGLATVYSIFGQEQTSLICPVDGMVLGMTTMPAVSPGGPVCNIAVIPPKNYDRIVMKMAKRSEDNLYSRAQEDLSTSIAVQDINGGSNS